VSGLNISSAGHNTITAGLYLKLRIRGRLVVMFSPKKRLHMLLVGRKGA
jgi:hypothetical protein